MPYKVEFKQFLNINGLFGALLFIMKSAIGYWEDREVLPNEENMYLVTGIEKIIAKIAATKNLKQMFEELGVAPYYDEKYEKDYSFGNGNFKDFLEKNFFRLVRGNTMGMVPPLFVWKLHFDNLNITLNKEQGNELLNTNFSYYKNRIQPYIDGYKLTVPVFYHLGYDKFENFL